MALNDEVKAMFCYNCGKEIDDKAVVCVGCGVAIGKKFAPPGEKSTIYNKLTFIFSLLSISLTVFAFVFVISAFEVYTWVQVSGNYIYSGSSIYSDTWGLVLGWVCAGFALFSGAASTIICFLKKQGDKFRPILSAVLSISSIIFLIIITVEFS